MPDPTAQVPTADEIVGKGVDKLVELRPRALAHINDGQGSYAKIVAGWRAQAAIMVRRLADYAVNGRLAFASGDPLSFLVASEYDTLDDLGPKKAIGSVVLTRTGALPRGTIRKGARFTRSADTSSQQLYGDASYEVARNVLVRSGDVALQVPLIASREGAFANRPLTGTLASELEIADEIHDRASWTVFSYEAAGGSDGVSEDDLKHYARAFSRGQYGPTDRAAIAGAFRAGAKRVIALDDPTVAALRLFVGDASWGGSAAWANAVRQSLSDARLVGFGCKVLVSSVTNLLVTVETTCKVRSPSFLADTNAIEASIQKALRAYLDDRPDWNRWTLRALRGVVARADSRIQSCSSVTVKDLAGNVVPEPTTSSATHYYLLQNGVKSTLLNPT